MRDHKSPDSFTSVKSRADEDTRSALDSLTGPTEWSSVLGKSWRNNLGGLEATLAPVNDALSAKLNLTGEMRVADIGCGGGGLTRHLARVTAKGSHITGFDISQDLVDAAKITETLLPIDFVCADAEKHSVDGELFDRLTSRFGIMFFANERAAFENLRSWLKPGGRFAFAVWANFTDNPWMAVVRDVAKEFIDIPEADHNQPGPIRYADVEHFTTLLENAGFLDISVTAWEGFLKLGGGRPALEAAEFGLSAFWGQDLPVSSTNHKRALKRLAAELQEHEVAGEVSMRANVQIFTGRV